MSESELVEYYRHRAAEYEQIYYRDDPARRAELAAEAGRLQELARGRRVLDPACGSGWWLPYMSGAESIVAADISMEMLSVARTKGLPCPVEFVQADLYHPPFRPGCFDLITVGFWLSHHPRQEYSSLFEAISEPLAPGGRLWLIDNNPPAEGATLQTVRHDEYGNRYARRYLDDGRPFVILKNYFARDDLSEILESFFVLKRLTYGKCYWSAVCERR
jgi:SAM-dependent methyltransferase